MDDGSRVLICGGSDTIRDLVSSCYYLQRNGVNLEIGKGPGLDFERRNGCYASDGHGFVIVGGGYRD